MKKGTKIAIVIVVILISVVIIFAGLFWITFIQPFIQQYSNARGLVAVQMSHTNDAKFILVENQAQENVSFLGFSNENHSNIRLAGVDEQFWNGSCYVLPPHKYVTLCLLEQQYYSKEIYVEFSELPKDRVKLYCPFITRSSLITSSTSF